MHDSWDSVCVCVRVRACARVFSVVLIKSHELPRQLTDVLRFFSYLASENRCSPNDMFLCTESKVCISKALFCDGIDHCGDGTDEPEDCGEIIFRC